MKKIIFVFVVFLFCFSGLFALKYKGKNVEVHRGRPWTWVKMGGDVSCLEKFEDHMRLLVAVGVIAPDCADSLISNFNNDIKEKVVVTSGERFDGECYGGKYSPNIIVRLAQVTIGENFNVKPASAWLVKAYNSLTGKLFCSYWFQNNLNGKVQCNNHCWKELNLPKPPPEPSIEIKYVPEPYEVVVHDTVYVDRPYPVYQTVTDTIFVEVIERRLCAHVWGWVSGATDLFGEPFFRVLGTNGYTLVDYNTTDKGIYSGIVSIGGKVCLKDNFAIIAGFEGGYQDGPYDWHTTLGVQWQPIRRNFFEMGWRRDYREFAHLKCEYYELTDERIWERFSMSYIPIPKEDGIYAGYEKLSMDGNNHFQVFANTVLNKNPRTYAVTGSLKLEPKRWYMFASGGYQLTPSEMVDTLRAPGFEHYSFDARVGRSFSENWLLFVSHREIFHIQNRDDQNEWSRFRRCDYRVGAFYRPKGRWMIEGILGYTKTCEQLEDQEDRSDDLMECKLTLFWNMPSRYLH